ncbi:MAG: ABC transporter permease [Nitrososphaeria archaeon]|nr:ABC transporter permease [Nitrososphaeria archaeon]
MTLDDQPPLFLNPEVLGITLLSFQVSCTAVFLAAIISIPIGTLLGLKDFRGKQLIITLTNTLMGLPPVVVGLLLYLLLSRSGPLGPLSLLYTPTAMILAQFIMATPVIVGLTYSTISAVSQRIVEQTISLGATRRQLLLIMLKESKMGILTSIIAAFGGAISEVGAIMIVGGNIRYFTRTLTTAIVLYTSMGEFDIAITLGIILLTTSFIINLFLTYMQSKYKPEKGRKFNRGIRFGD